MAANIPGYYYDADKRRYFKIEKSNTAPGHASWSSESVKKRKLEDEDAAAALRRMQLNKNRIVRSRALAEPLMGGFFAREYGDVRPDVPAAGFAKGLVEKGQLPLADARWTSSSNVKHMYIGGQDHKTGVCTAYATLDELTLISTYVPKDRNGRVHRRLLADYVTPANHIAPYQELAVAQISDIKYHERSNQILVTSRSPGNEVSMWAFAPKVTESDDRRPHWLLGWNGVTVYMNLKVPGDSRFNDYQANCVAPAPAASPVICTVGTSRGITQWDSSGCMKWLTPWGPGHYYSHPNAFRDVFALDYAQPGPRRDDLLLFGGRPGRLFTGDTRVRADRWAYHKLGSSITHVRGLNEHQALVAGLNNALSVYDLRFMCAGDNKNGSGSNKKTTTRAKGGGGGDAGDAKMAKNSTRTTTTTTTATAAPLCVFEGYRNVAHVHTGLDYDGDTGVVAAAHDDGTVALYSVRSGARLRSPDVDRIRSARGPVQSLQFQTFPGDHAPTLFAGVGSNVNAYSFGVESLGDEA